eukprot:Opistho-1_new@86368
MCVCVCVVFGYSPQKASASVCVVEAVRSSRSDLRAGVPPTCDRRVLSVCETSRLEPSSSSCVRSRLMSPGFPLPYFRLPRYPQRANIKHNKTHTPYTTHSHGLCRILLRRRRSPSPPRDNRDGDRAGDRPVSPLKDNRD